MEIKRVSMVLPSTSTSMAQAPPTLSVSLEESRSGLALYGKLIACCWSMQSFGIACAAVGALPPDTGSFLTSVLWLATVELGDKTMGNIQVCESEIILTRGCAD